MPYEIDWRPNAILDVHELFEYLVVNASLWDAKSVTECILGSTDKLAEFPRLYEAAPQYGEGVRRISLLGQNVLYVVDDWAQVVRVLAVVGTRQLARKIR